MPKGTLGANIVKVIFGSFRWLLYIFEIDLLARLMVGVGLSEILPFGGVPLGFLSGIGMKAIPLGFIIALVLWALQLMVVASLLKKFDLVRWTPFNKREASWMMGEANGVRRAGPNWDMPGEELITVDQTERQITFTLGPADDRIHTKDKIVIEGTVRFQFAPSNPQAVTAFGGIDFLLEGKLKALATDILDQEVQKHDYKDVMPLMSEGKFGKNLKKAMDKVKPTDDETSQLKEFPGMRRHAKKAKTALELYGIRLTVAYAHFDENESIAVAARKAMEAKESVKTAREEAKTEAARAKGKRRAVENLLGLKAGEAADLSNNQILEAARVLNGDSTSSTEHKRFGADDELTEAAKQIVIALLARKDS